MLSYSLVVPAILVEGHKAMPGLRRSRDLVKGYRGKIFLVMIVINLLQAVLAGGVGVVSSFLLTSDAGATAVLSSALGNLLSILLTPLGIIAAILLYYDMRIRKEGFDLEMLSLAVSTQSPAAATTAILSR